MSTLQAIHTVLEFATDGDEYCYVSEDVNTVLYLSEQDFLNMGQPTEVTVRIVPGRNWGQG